MAAEKHSSTRRRVLGAAVALPVLALAGGLPAPAVIASDAVARQSSGDRPRGEPPLRPLPPPPHPLESRSRNRRLPSRQRPLRAGKGSDRGTLRQLARCLEVQSRAPADESRVRARQCRGKCLL